MNINSESQYLGAEHKGLLKDINSKKETNAPPDINDFMNIIPFEPLFFIVESPEFRVIAVQKEDENGYDGLIITFRFSAERKPQYYFDSSPFGIAKSFVNILIKKYDFTNDSNLAYSHCKQRLLR